VNGRTGAAHLHQPDRTWLVRFESLTAFRLVALAVRKLRAKNFFDSLDE
jgi:hypothetical protein